MTEYEVREKMTTERICVIVPTFNHAGAILNVLRRVLLYTQNVIVVDDGCTDQTFQLITNAHIAVTLISYPKNRGKGYALKQGFQKAVMMGFEYAITIDSDGQHFPEDLPLFIESFENNQGAFIIGIRNLTENNMPRKNTFANQFSNFWFFVQTGQHLKDTQSGYRLYPLSQLNAGWFTTYRYEAELKLLVYYAWKGIRIIQLPVRVYYPPVEERVSHFRPFWDFVRIFMLNTWLCVLAVTIYYPGHILKKLKR